MAVEEFNTNPGSSGTQVRMVFRESSTDAIKTTRSVRELADQDVSLFIGPLYSAEALTAAAVAEEEQVVMIAPLATDEEVSQDREYVYQANPTITMRGRLMARLAVTGLRHERFGIIAEFDNAVSEKMAEGFQDEILELGGEIDFVDLLPGFRRCSSEPCPSVAWISPFCPPHPKLPDRRVRESSWSTQSRPRKKACRPKPAHQTLGETSGAGGVLRRTAISPPRPACRG